MSDHKYDLIVIGSGPAGEVGAIRAAQLGMKVAIVEKHEHLGGTCLNFGCIPTKCLIESAKTWMTINKAAKMGFTVEASFDWKKIQERKDSIVDAQRKGLRFLMKKNKIDVYQGIAKFKNSNEINVEHTDDKNKQSLLRTKFTLIACGSKVRELSIAKANGKNIYSSDTILSIDSVPNSICIVGGGVVGMEFACLFARFGSAVTVLELAPRILPSEDEETVAELVKTLKKQGVNIQVGAKLTEVKDKGKSCLVQVEGLKPQEFSCVLMSPGRVPCIDLLKIENTKTQHKNGTIVVDSHYQSTDPSIYAVGDVIATPALAHTASAEAIHAVECMSGHFQSPINYETNPSAIYTYPEIASIGKNEEKLKALGIAYKVAKFPFAPLAKAKIEDVTEGFVKILYDPQFRELLGVHIVGAKATELISEFVLGKVLETTVDEIGLAIHPHPTLSETNMEAAHVAVGGAIHL